jgi:hypothetical protein
VGRTSTQELRLIAIDGMVYEWAVAVPSLLAGAVILLLPGIVAAMVLGVRLFDAVAVAPLISITVISITAIVGEKLGLDWSPGVFAGAVVVLWLLCLALRLVFLRWPMRRPAPTHGGGAHTSEECGKTPERPADVRGPDSDRSRYYFGAALIAAVIIGLQCIRVFGTPSSFSQTFDNVFHLNAVRYVLNTADASSLTLTSMTTAGEAPYFYPAAWHGFAALIIQSTGVDLTIGVTSANLLICALVWPLSCLFAVRQLRTLSRPSILAAGVIVSAFAAFPVLLLEFGVLYPNLLSLAMVPAGLTLVAAAVGQAPATRITRSRAAVLALLSLPGIAVAHPNGAMTLVALSVPMVIALYVGLLVPRLRGGSYLQASIVTVALLLGVLILGKVWEVVRPPAAAAFWDRVETSSQALGEALLNAPFGRPAAWAVSTLVVVGLITCVRDRRLLWFAGAFAVSTAVFIVAAGFEISELRSYITGVWYNDPYRLAAIAPLTAAPLAIIGADFLLKAAAERMRTVDGYAQRQGQPALVLSFSIALVALLVAPPLLNNRSMDAAIATAGAAYTVTPDSSLVSSDELELIERLDETTDPDGTIAVNPWTGAALAYALADRDTTYKHVLSNSSATDLMIDQFLKDADSRPGVCSAAESRNIEYVLDFGTREVHGGDHRYPGLEGIASDDDFDLIDQVGEAKLYEFVGCS